MVIARNAEPPSPASFEMFLPPSVEARRLVRRLGWLVAPNEGEETILSRALGVVVVAPFTQLTFFSYDLQAFLFAVFHTRWPARFAHFAFMLAVNFFVMAGLSAFDFGLDSVLVNGATSYASLLLVWYGVLARLTGFWGLWLLMLPVVGGLCAGAQLFAALTSDAGVVANPWLWMMVSAFLIALSHAPEPWLPPRVNETRGWMPTSHYLLGPPGRRHSPARVAVRLVRLGLQLVWGTLDELWASPRLLPYNFLMLLFRFGYRPDAARRLREHVERALASGNPALDYVGIGGGRFLRRTPSGL